MLISASAYASGAQAAGSTPAKALRPITDTAAPLDVLAVRDDPDGRRTVFLRGSARMPDVDSPFVIVATEKFDGVLGIVTTAGRHRSGAIRVGIRPATLEQAYAKLDIQLKNAELDDLDLTWSPIFRA